MEVKGRDLVTGIPKILTIDSDEVREAISDQINTIVETVHASSSRSLLNWLRTSWTAASMLTGGGALLRNLDGLLRNETKLPIHISEDPLSGGGRRRRQGAEQSLHPQRPGRDIAR